MKPPSLKCACPACGAGFRGVPLCPRCGADLTALMRVIAAAFHLRTAARAALQRGDQATAERLARQAAQLHRLET